MIDSLDELTKFVAELVLEDYPHSRAKVCEVVDHSHSHWDTIKRIGEKLRSEHGLHTDGHEIFFNHHELTESVEYMVEGFVHNNWEFAGF